MNVMAQAHKTVKEAIKAQVELGNGRTHTYAQMLSIALKLAHKEFKAIQENKELTVKLAVVGISLAVEKDAIWFSLEGTATDSEGNKISIGEGGAYASSVQHSADWYFCRDNGFTNIELYACRWDYKNEKESFKIVR